MITLKLKSIFDRNIFATNVVLKVPCPRDTALVNAHCREGRARYEPDQGGIVWRIKKFRGDHDLLLRADVTRLRG